MLMQDTLTGYVHEVPDSQLYETEVAEYPDAMGEGQVVYDGLGNPVGFLKWIKKAVRRVAPLISRFAPFLPVPGAALLGPAAQALQRAIPRPVRRFAPAAAAFQRGGPAMMQPPAAPPAESEAPPEAVEGFYAEAPRVTRVVPAVPGRPMRPLPPGWIRRPSPYQGRKGRRVYLRCALWPGPRGLVPAYAAQMPPVVTAPAPPAAAVVRTAPPRRGPRRIIRRRR